MVQGSMSCIKYLMFFFNFIFVICGIAIISVGGLAFKNDFTEFFGNRYATAPVILIVLGVIIFAIAFLGCCGAIRENHCMVMTFGLLMFVIFVATLAGGITAYMYKNDVENFLKTSMNESIAQNKEKANKVWDDMQSQFHCCGVDGASDYVYNNRTVPKSCCNKEDPVCTEINAYQEGCLDHVLNEMKKNIALVGGFGVGVAIIELLGCIFAWCLASAIKRDYEGV